MESIPDLVVRQQAILGAGIQSIPLHLVPDVVDVLLGKPDVKLRRGGLQVIPELAEETIGSARW